MEPRVTITNAGTHPITVQGVPIPPRGLILLYLPGQDRWVVDREAPNGELA